MNHPNTHDQFRLPFNREYLQQLDRLPQKDLESIPITLGGCQSDHAYIKSVFPELDRALIIWNGALLLVEGIRVVEEKE